MISLTMTSAGLSQATLTHPRQGRPPTSSGTPKKRNFPATHMLSCFELLSPAAQGLETSPVSLLLPKAQIEDERHQWGFAKSGLQEVGASSLTFFRGKTDPVCC